MVSARGSCRILTLQRNTGYRVSGQEGQFLPQMFQSCYLPGMWILRNLRPGQKEQKASLGSMNNKSWRLGSIHSSFLLSWHQVGESDRKMNLGQGWLENPSEPQSSCSSPYVPMKTATRARMDGALCNLQSPWSSQWPGQVGAMTFITGGRGVQRLQGAELPQFKLQLCLFLAVWG